jgi:hypothetical protein
VQDLPAGIMRDLPLVSGHKFIKLDDCILVVDRESRLDDPA